MDPVTGVLVQYGAVGAVAVMAIAAVRVLFTRLQAAVDREAERADRLEEELRRLNETVRNDYIGTIATAAQAISDANRAVADALAAVRRG